MSKAKLPVLEEKIVIPADTDNMPCGCLSKPHIGVCKGLFVLPLKGAEIPAVNQNIALRNRELPVLAVGVGYNA